MSGGMEEWGHGAPGRIVTWPAPDAYVLVEGVLLRMVPDSPGMAPGAEVVVRYDASRHRLVAREPDGTDRADRVTGGGTDQAPRGGADRVDGSGAFGDE
ncbi:hypothetical protein [Streptomyces sp. NBC_00094]|uniref:hypothetical protein n=1 Tax=Streptomyces sp. NBC_00094 TaxID=2903620 RepID=UPI00225A503A|nr:hypothetical protein [Streptomyces sp. NBC_00094]MCX5393760.1 hypothetical protein [Streptomyces sp. NBC_00094]